MSCDMRCVIRNSVPPLLVRYEQVEGPKSRIDPQGRIGREGAGVTKRLSPIPLFTTKNTKSTKPHKDSRSHDAPLRLGVKSGPSIYDLRFTIYE